MNILAKRSNLIFYVSAIVVPICILILVYARDLFQFIEAYSLGRSGRRFMIGVICFTISVFAVCVYSFFQRLTVPKVIIEYDENFIYINKTKNEPTIVLRYSEIKGAFSDEFVGDNTESEGVTSSASVLRIQTVDRIITIYGIKNCTDVKFALNRLVKEYTQKRMEQYDQHIEQSKRLRELEELQKHDPNT